MGEGLSSKDATRAQHPRGRAHTQVVHGEQPPKSCLCGFHVCDMCHHLTHATPIAGFYCRPRGLLGSISRETDRGGGCLCRPSWSQCGCPVPTPGARPRKAVVLSDASASPWRGSVVLRGDVVVLPPPAFCCGVLPAWALSFPRKTHQPGRGHLTLQAPQKSPDSLWGAG